MFRYGISASLEELPIMQAVTLRGDIDSLCRQAKEIGYDALELHIRKPARYDPVRIRDAARDHGLDICAVANGMEYTVEGLCLIDPDAEKRKAAFSRFLEHIDFSAELNALCISGVMRGSIPRGADRQKTLDIFTDVTRRLCEYAEKKNVVIVIESIMRHINNYLNGVPETIDWIVSTGIPNLALHIDTHSMLVEDRDMPASIRYCRGKPLGYVHYSDSNRLYPGGGSIDFKSLTRALVDVGYDGCITLESTALPSSYEAALRGYRYMRCVEEAARIEMLEPEANI